MNDILRLNFLMREGFLPDRIGGVKGDRYTYAMEIAKEAGRESSVATDEMDGLRRMIDEAIALVNKTRTPEEYTRLYNEALSTVKEYNEIWRPSKFLFALNERGLRVCGRAPSNHKPEWYPGGKPQEVPVSFAPSKTVWPTLPIVVWSQLSKDENA